MFHIIKHNKFTISKSKDFYISVFRVFFLFFKLWEIDFLFNYYIGNTSKLVKTEKIYL